MYIALLHNRLGGLGYAFTSDEVVRYRSHLARLAQASPIQSFQTGKCFIEAK